MACSGIHRKLGTHISQVRSVTLDTWTPAQIANFRKLGNAKAAKYFEACIPAQFRRPHSADSMRMEALIRDKYEHRRFITVENGGLGGADTRPAHLTASHRFGAGSRAGAGAARGRAGFGTQASFAAAGPRPYQQPMPAAPYDDGGRPASANSYAARFSSASAGHHANGGGSVDPVARSATLKQLTTMGFAAPLALRAVEASNGNLQRAVDWLLLNARSGAAVAAPHASAQASTGMARKHEPDLLDFGGDAAASAAPAAAPKKPSHVADFADFGNFESALPVSGSAAAGVAASSGRANMSSSTGATKPLSSTLADLYKQAPPKVSLSSSPRHAARAGAGVQVSTSPPRLVLQGASGFPGRRSPIAKAVVNGSTMGLPFIDLKSANLSTAKAKATKQTTAPIATAGAIKAMERGNGSTIVPITQASPPPPPPMQDIAFAATAEEPPPSPRNPLDTAVLKEETNEQVDDVDNESSPSAVVDIGLEAKEEVKEEEESDPFAALSMMALSSASTVKKKVPMTKNVQMVSSAVDASDSNAGTVERNVAIDDLLG